MPANLQLVEVDKANVSWMNPTAVIYSKSALVPDDGGSPGGCYLYDRSNRVLLKPVYRKKPVCVCEKNFAFLPAKLEFPKCLAEPMTPATCVRGPISNEWVANMLFFMLLWVMSAIKWVVDRGSLPDDFNFAKYPGENKRCDVYFYLFSYPEDTLATALGSVDNAKLYYKMGRCGETGQVSQF